MIDSPTVAILAAITWFDGLRRLGEHVVLLQQLPTGRWRVANVRSSIFGLTLVSWWAPLVVPLVLSNTSQNGQETTLQRSAIHLARCGRRLQRAKPMVRILRILGIVTTLGIVLGVPAATARFGSFGLLYSVCGVVALSFGTALCSYVMLRRLGLGSRPALGRVLHLASPFSSSRASETVLAQATADTPALLVIRELLSPVAFNKWIRPMAYDTIHEHGAEALDFRRTESVKLWGFEYLQTIIGSTPPDSHGAELYCPRCGQLYVAGPQQCSECVDPMPTLLRIIPS